ncbi:MAG: helix-turn-helix domain-containing protein [Pseudomonadota bacterium]
MRDVVAIGERIFALRRERGGLSQEEVAGDARIAPGYLSRIETGQRVPTIEVLERIAHALGVPLWRFFADRRTGPEEVEWERRARELADAVRTLDDEDLAALVTVARRMGRASRIVTAWSQRERPAPLSSASPAKPPSPTPAMAPVLTPTAPLVAPTMASPSRAAAEAAEQPPSYGNGRSKSKPAPRRRR